MKKSNKNLNLSFLIWCTLFFTQLSIGQTDLEDALGFNETVNDVPEAPIHIFIGLAVLIGSYIGYKKLKD